jgi:predicted ATP-grasp superfamily ATP-dependent carboligase
MRILVTDGSYRQTLGIVRSLGREHQVLVASPKRFAMAAASRYASGHMRSPAASEAEAFLEWIERAIKRHRIELVMPVGAASCRALAVNRDRLRDVKVVLPDPDKMELALDKRRTMAVAAANDIPVPATEQPKSMDDLEAAGARVGYPLVLKGPIEGPSGVRYVDEPGDLRSAVDAYVQRYPLPGGELPMLQQRIVGPGFGVFVTYQDGRLCRIMSHRRIREFPVTGGESSCCEVADDPILLDQSRRLMDALVWHGVAMVEFKKHDADGRYYLMEINPKFWGSLDLALAAGADFPGDLVRIAAGETLTEPPPPTGSLRFCWPLSSDLRHLRARPSDWRAVIGDALRPSVRTNVRPTDPFPGAIELAAAVAHIVTGR